MGGHGFELLCWFTHCLGTLWQLPTSVASTGSKIGHWFQDWIRLVVSKLRFDARPVLKLDRVGAPPVLKPDRLWQTLPSKLSDKSFLKIEI